MYASIKSSAIAAITALSIAAVPAAPAHAWGDKEKGFVAGVATAVIIDEILKQSRRSKAAPYPAPRPVYSAPVTTPLYATPAARVFNTYSHGERKAIQRSLRRMGYYHGGIDGTFGSGTYRATVAYARDAGAAGNLNSNAGMYSIYDGLIY